ncbi:hypothetical protein [Chromobacterium violaceum]|uniref:hypothetical protein n=1 Tax=Chromobacterium violaceum TaxID=536 RepID=UPI001B34103D|nr:hypothetical protein [Chromobacterium violaceum]MBP4046803.1 hypothetical protein [Chromobacterium violaceum]
MSMLAVAKSVITLTALAGLSGMALAGDWVASKPSGCKAWSDDVLEGEALNWNGGCKDGLAEGQGELAWRLDDNHGFSYVGRLKAGRMDGNGKLTTRDTETGTTVREGEWKDGAFTGQGVYQVASCRLSGGFVDGQAEGMISMDCHGRRFEGLAKGGLFNGYGTAWLSQALLPREVAAAEKRKLGYRTGDEYVLLGWWENGQLRQACVSPQDCAGKIAKLNAKQAKQATIERRAGIKPYLGLSEDSGGTVPIRDYPYQWKTADGQVLVHGLTDKQGLAVVAQRAGVSEYQLETAVIRASYHVEAECWQRPAKDFTVCARLVSNVIKAEEEEEAKRRSDALEAAQRAKHRQEEYVRLRASGADELGWLGPLPESWSEDQARQKGMALMERLKSDLDGLKPQDYALEGFQCRAPQDFGPVPGMSALRALFADSHHGRASDAWPGVVQAAREGNWMARFQLYKELGERKADELSLADEYRRLQLMEWLLDKNVGSIYSNFMDELAGSGYFDGSSPPPQSPIYVYAGLRGSYSTLDRVGKALLASEDRAARSAGQKMRDCAHQAMPELFSE